jgi:hypothetical protein
MEVEFRALYNGSVTGSGAWTFPTSFNRLARFGDSAVTPTDTTQLTLQLWQNTSSSNPSLIVNAIGQAATNHYWTGLFHVTATRR